MTHLGPFTIQLIAVHFDNYVLIKFAISLNKKKRYFEEIERNRLIDCKVSFVGFLWGSSLYKKAKWF